MLDVGSVSRAARGLSLDPVRALDARRNMLGYDALGEIEEQFQLPISGTASTRIGWVEMEIPFQVEFYNATEQRNIPYTVPHFSHGAVITSPVPVLITVCVREWKKRNDDAVTGCTVALGALSGSPVAVSFEGYVHLAFQGYGAPGEQGADLEAPE